MRTRCNFKAPRESSDASSPRARALTRAALVAILLLAFASPALADELKLVDGSTMQVDEAWEDAQGVWYRRGGVTYLVERSRVRQIVKASRGAGAREAPGEKTKEPGANKANDVTVVKAASDDTQKSSDAVEIWIYLVGGARMEVDEANEAADGVWYKRGNISTFVERARVDHVERVVPQPDAAAADSKGRPREFRWTTGSARLDSIIRQNGARYGVDPYLVFCVMEQESHFNSRAVSPAGARGLMQLMPGTAARFGVRNAADPAQNVSAGTRYLKQLLGKFGGRVDLVLAGYNAGEGNVTRFGNRVPPFRETRNYVLRVGSRYTKGE
ncbi:MAG TPA: lytic transglycosylase domain-containing protein [Pyrinomonadaceae bacterium]|nr:lytic transglycosylase domain-containing protein [Pyrinomonadaceae bacterium]